MNIKSVLVFVIMFSLMLGCAETDTSSEVSKKNLEEELSFDEKF